jgi:hypothetical protein
VKTDRGDVNRDNRAFDDTYWRERNDAAHADTSIQRHLPALAHALAELRADPEIDALHRDCVARHIARLDALLAMPEFREMRETLRNAHPLPPQEQAMLTALGLAP